MSGSERIVHQQQRRFSSIRPSLAKFGKTLFSGGGTKKVPEVAAEVADKEPPEEKEKSDRVNDDDAQEEKQRQHLETTKNGEEQQMDDKQLEVHDEGELVQPVPMDKSDDRPMDSGDERKAPEPKPRKGRRSSVVHPLEIDEDGKSFMDSGGKLPKPRLFLGTVQKNPSQPSPWLYVQTENRSFKRTTEEAELRAEQNLRQTLAPDPVILPPEFAFVSMALAAQNFFHNFSQIIQGFISGLAFGHALFAFLFTDINFISQHPNGTWWLSNPAQAFFYVCLAIAVVDELDGFQFIPSGTSPGLIFRSLCSFSTLSVLLWGSALLASISSAQIDELMARRDGEKVLAKNDHALFTLWQILSAIRAGGTMLGWFASAFRLPASNATRKELEKIIQTAQEVTRDDGKG